MDNDLITREERMGRESVREIAIEFATLSAVLTILLLVGGWFILHLIS